MTVRRYVKHCLEAFLEGKQSFKWIVQVITMSGVQQYKGMLIGIFYELKGCDERSPRFSAICKECQQNGWL